MKVRLILLLLLHNVYSISQNKEFDSTQIFLSIKTIIYADAISNQKISVNDITCNELFFEYLTPRIIDTKGNCFAKFLFVEVLYNIPNISIFNERECILRINSTFSKKHLIAYNTSNKFFYKLYGFDYSDKEKMISQIGECNSHGENNKMNNINYLKKNYTIEGYSIVDIMLIKK